MKIRCESCAAKYAIRDDKVRGRVFKIRCKRCQSPIVVRGPALLEAPPAAPAEGELTGVRNESSVLFSVSNLSALARSAPPPQAAAPDTGSGLIDMRTLAASLSAAPAPTTAPERVDDLLTIGAPVGGALSAPVIPRAPQSPRRLGTILGASVAAFAILVVGVVLAVVGARDARARVTAEKTSEIEAGDAVEAPIADAPPPDDPPAPTTPEVAPDPDPAPAPEVATDAPDPSRPTRVRPHRREPIAREETPAEPAPRGERSIEALIAETLGEQEQPQARMRPTRTPPPSRPEVPTRAQVTRAMDGVSGAVSACGEGAHGLVPVSIVFAGDSGRVASARVDGGSLAPAARSCVARAVRGARLPAFGRDRFTVRYPFRL